jgi:hypothetical protein
MVSGPAKYYRSFQLEALLLGIGLIVDCCALFLQQHQLALIWSDASSFKSLLHAEYLSFSRQVCFRTNAPFAIGLLPRGSRFCNGHKDVVSLYASSPDCSLSGLFARI